ncbi:MAG TPA: 30S ribosomal protein S20 [Candidatus Paceibacterota bacterium]
MPVTNSAKKANRASKRKRVFNVRSKNSMKNAVKAYKALVSSGNKVEAEKALAGVYKAIDKAKKRGVIKPNKASRDKSRLTALLSG